MRYTVYLIGHPLQPQALSGGHAEAFARLGLPVDYERRDIPPVNFHRELTALLREPGFLGAKIVSPYKQTALAYCQELGFGAQGAGSVNTLLRRPSGLIHGENTDVGALLSCMREEGPESIRTALILGAGGAARVAVAALREMGCARYLIGYRHPRRPQELASQFKSIRRQIAFFSLAEMEQFLEWAVDSGVFARGVPMPPPSPVNGKPAPSRRSGRERRAHFAQSAEDGIKRWNVLVNATPVGQEGLNSAALVSSTNFLRCFERIVDMIPSAEPTELVKMTRTALVPAITGAKLFDLQAQLSRELWVKELKRSSSGKAGKAARNQL